MDTEEDMDKEKRAELLLDHHKDTFTHILHYLSTRNRLFGYILAILVLLAFDAYSPGSLTDLVNAYVAKTLHSDSPTATIPVLDFSVVSSLAWFVLLGTLPVAVLGLLLHDVIETYLRSPLVIAAATIGFGVLLGLADWRGRQRRDEHALRTGDVIIIGLAQALALIPGTSRSGITMTAGLALGMTRSAAARSIPCCGPAAACWLSRQTGRSSSIGRTWWILRTETSW